MLFFHFDALVWFRIVYPVGGRARASLVIHSVTCLIGSCTENPDVTKETEKWTADWPALGYYIVCVLDLCTVWRLLYTALWLAVFGCCNTNVNKKMETQLDVCRQENFIIHRETVFFPCLCGASYVACNVDHASSVLVAKASRLWKDDIHRPRLVSS